MPAASARERSSESSSTGTSSRRSPRTLPPLAAAQRLGGPHPPEAVGQVRQHGDRDDERAADLVERRRHRAEQPLGVGQGVGGADADHDGGEPEPVVQAEEQRLLGDRPEQPEPERPVRQRDRRQVRAARGRRRRRPRGSGRPRGSPRSPGRARGRGGTSRPTAARCGVPTTARQATPISIRSSQGLVVNEAATARPTRPEPPGDGVQVPRQAGDREAGAHQAPPARFRRTTATARRGDEERTDQDAAPPSRAGRESGVGPPCGPAARPRSWSRAGRSGPTGRRGRGLAGVVVRGMRRRRRVGRTR